MEQQKYDDPVKSPVVQEIIMSNRIGSISVELAKRLNIEPVKALQMFYESKTCEDLHDSQQAYISTATFMWPMSL